MPRTMNGEPHNPPSRPVRAVNRKESTMETLICRMLLACGLIVGVLLAGGQGEYVLAPALLALVGAGVLRRVGPSLPWHAGHGRY